MGLADTPAKVEQWLRGDGFVVRVEVDAIVPDFDPSEPCLAPAAIWFLDEVQEKANRGLMDQLAKVGEVYVRRWA